MKGLPWPPMVKTPVLPVLGEMGLNTGDRTETPLARRWGQKTKKKIKKFKWELEWIFVYN